jgi:tetratricopeptide (TPR) repeat protein
MNDKDIELAYRFFDEAYRCSLEGELETAIELYRRSIETFPTAEAHAFLGWTPSFQGRLDEAIAECKEAIRIDPEFGNPYNDIGTHLIEKSQYQEAIPWLKSAAGARHYSNPHFAYYNLARAYIGLERFTDAEAELENALRISPNYEMAREALLILKTQIQ